MVEIVSLLSGSDPEFEKGGGPNRRQGHTIALPGSDPGDEIVDNLCSYFSEPHHHEATNTMSILSRSEGGGQWWIQWGS
jgi:hypothetical protein